MTKEKSNGVWKWVAGILGPAAVTVGLLMYTGTQARISEGNVAILEALKEVKVQVNLHDSSISRLNTIGAVDNQWQQMIEKKIDLLLRHNQIPEYLWPSIPADTTGGQ
ncbi:MAG TPA: hypothetical protein DCZ63_11450 [Geobacter sp.]|nr:hypothetical protein [Geobacter sp.]